MTCTVTNVAHIVLCSRSLFFTPLSLAAPAPAESPSLSLSLSRFTLSLPIPLPLLPPISHTLSSLHHALTSFINVSALTPFSSPPLPSPHLSLSHYLFFPTPVALAFAFFHTHSLSHLCTFFSPPGVSVSLFLRVISQVDWPLNIIITDSCMNKYNRLFSFLLQLKHMVWSLREVWFHLKRTGERVGAFDPGQAQTPRYL